MGAFLTILSSVIYGVEPTIRAFALRQGMPTGLSLVFSVGTIFLIYTLICLFRREKLSISPESRVYILIQGVLFAVTCFLLADSYQYIPVGPATVIHFTYPSVVCVVMAVFIRKRFRPIHLLCIVLSVAGLALITGGGLEGSPRGIALAFTSGLCYAAYITRENIAQPKEKLPAAVRMFHLSGVLFVLHMAMALADGAFTGVSLSTVLPLVGCGAMSALALVSFSTGIRKIGAMKASFLSTLEPVTGMIVASAVYGDAFTPVTLIGCALTLLSMLCVTAAERET